jgi:hypothetical protein
VALRAPASASALRPGQHAQRHQEPDQRLDFVAVAGGFAARDQAAQPDDEAELNCAQQCQMALRTDGGHSRPLEQERPAQREEDR